MPDFISKVMRTAYTSLNQNPLSNYAKNVVTMTTDNKTYDPIRTDLDALKLVSDHFGDLLVAIENGDRTKIREKDVVMAQLITALNTVGDALNILSNGDIMIIFNAGMHCQTSNRRQRIEPGVPTILSLTPTKMVGMVDVVMLEAEGLRNFAFEWSSNGGETWKNGQYSTRLRTTLEVDPHSEVIVRACTLGSGKLKSAFSAPMTCRVL